MSLLRGLIVVSALSACERDPLAPSVSPRCGDGVAVAGEVCLSSSAVDIPYTYDFIRRVHSEPDSDNFFAMSQWFQQCWALFFTPITVTEAPQPITSFEFTDRDLFHPEVADLDGDGRTDLISVAQYWFFDGVSDFQQARFQIEYWHNIGGFKFELADFTYTGNLFFPTLAIGDVNGDGIDDAVVIDASSEGYVWTHEPGAKELKAFSIDLEPLQLVAHPFLAAADRNGDAYADFVLTDGTGRVWWLIGGPEHRLTVLDPAGSLALDPEPGSLYARDLDDDGHVDLVAVRMNTSEEDRPTDSISVARGRADGGFERLTSFETQVRLTFADLEFFPAIPLAHLGFIDLDGTGQLALVYAHHERPELIVHPHIARTQGAAPVTLPLDFPAKSLFVDDLDADGDPSIYVAITDRQTVEPSHDEPDGVLERHYLVQFVPDP